MDDLEEDCHHITEISQSHLGIWALNEHLSIKFG